MDVMQDSAKRDLEGTEVEKSLPRQLRPVPGSVFQPGGQLLTLCFERHHDPQCFVQIEVPLADWPPIDRGLESTWTATKISVLGNH
jgi:hypothetical protein